jgi:hypothetical protein
MAIAGATDGQTDVTAALKRASRSTGAGFDYLFRTAMRESRLNPDAKAQTSSAAGLFQFIESTWLETVKQAGPEHGLGQYADQIKMTRSGKPVVGDPAMRREILALRYDPAVASVMAAELTERNEASLETRLGRNADDAELYMAHFMGARGAGRFIELAEANPEARADRLFPKEARANRPIFYTRGGRARTIAEVYDALAAQHRGGGKTEMASAAAANSEGPADQPFLNLLGFFRKRTEPVATEEGGRTMFRSLYAEGGADTARVFASSFWRDGSGPKGPVSDPLAPDAAARGDGTPLPAPRPAQGPSPVDLVVGRWLDHGRSGSVGKPLNLADASRLYGGPGIR